MRPPPRSTLFPYTTLFRSDEARHRLLRSPFHAGRQQHLGVGCASEMVPTRRKLSAQLLKIIHLPVVGDDVAAAGRMHRLDRKSTRLNSSHSQISYAVFCLK